MKKTILAFCVFNLLTFAAYGAQELSLEQTERVKAFKALLGDADARTFAETLSEIKKSPAAEGELQIREAVARTYDALLKKYQPAGREARVRLLDKIRMNMAYFQLGGSDTEDFSAGSLNVVIRRELEKYLSPGLRTDKRLFKSLDN